VSYSVEILKSAQKQLTKIDRTDRTRIVSAIRSLADEPRPQGTKKLSGRPAWRIRVGAFRIIYEIHDGRLTVIVAAIGNRQSEGGVRVATEPVYRPHFRTSKSYSRQIANWSAP
jgi:mRNA interferase RelE/StbE